MKSWMLLAVFLLLSVLIHETQGIRLIKGSISDNQHNIHGNSGELMKDGGVEEVILCKKNHCSSGRINRKLTMNPNNEENKAQPRLVGSSINKKIGRKEEKISVNPSSITEQPQPIPEPYPDIVDITGMDYSQARRKPPIHN